MELSDLLGRDGALAKARPGWEPREAQEKMVGAVWVALGRGDSLVVEAGTGIGKSLAYLLPAALWAVKNDRRVVVSTHTRALQEQLLHHELPTTAKALEILGLPLRYAMLMGSENYLCVQRLSRARLRQSTEDADALERLVRLEAWTKIAGSGHRSAVPEAVPQPVWERINRDPEQCMGPGGPYWDRCLWRKDRERAERAHILVVNHALLLSGARLPPADAMILDEAHNLEEAAVSRYGAAAGLSRVVSLCDEARGASKAYGLPELEGAADDCAASCARFLEEIARDHGVTGPDDEGPTRLLEKTPEIPPAGLIALDKALAAAATDAEGRPEETDLRMLHARVSQFGHEMMAVLKPGAGATARWVAWPRTGPELRAAPLDVGARLSEGLFSRGLPAILTSATLSTGEGLKDFKARVGVPEARELVLDSPFDYRTQAALWTVEGLPPPGDDDKYAKALTQACADIVGAVPGGVFLLFSSWKLLKKVHAGLRRKIKDRPVWAQGSSGHDALLREFEDAGNAVLLGVDTMWQGVDVPGEALSCVVLVKLPFPNPSTALEEARRRWLDENGRDYFRDWSVPKAVMKFRQGFGRLIRTSTDRGAVVCLDPRLKKGYGKFFLEALPPCKKLGSLDDLRAFFGTRAAQDGREAEQLGAHLTEEHEPPHPEVGAEGE